MSAPPTTEVSCSHCPITGELPLDESVFECPGCGNETWTYRAAEATEALTANE